jgi:phosphogluconate dehydratase
MTSAVHPVLAEVTNSLVARSAGSRAAYLERIGGAARRGPNRSRQGCANLAHGFAACPLEDKLKYKEGESPNIAIVSAYNDMLSAHQPYEGYPVRLRALARENGATAQVAGGVPAMCDGVTQGAAGMELSLFSRDLIAQATAIALSHDLFDGAVYLGVCDKIVPGLLIGALAFGHLPGIFIPAGPMPSGLSNGEKARIRQLYAEKKVDKKTLLEAEAASYHSPGTCTFYGTANSNQLLLEIMGLHIPGSTFCNPNTPERAAFDRAAINQICFNANPMDRRAPIGELVNERVILNGVVGLLASGGSTNHTLHLVAIARAAGIQLDWSDFGRLSEVVPLLARVYPNGNADVNHFAAAGGVGYLAKELMSHGLLHADVQTAWGESLAGLTRPWSLQNDVLVRETPLEVSRDEGVLRSVTQPFQKQGGMVVLEGELGRAIFKTSAVKPENLVVSAPAAVFSSQEEVLAAFSRGELDRDVIVVLRFQGPRANGMPELHKLTPALGVLQDRGFKVALVTDGRMSGASGKVPAAIHVCPEAALGGPIGRLCSGDVLTVDGVRGELRVEGVDWRDRAPATAPIVDSWSCGRSLFGVFRQVAAPADQGGGILTLGGE